MILTNNNDSTITGFGGSVSNSSWSNIHEFADTIDNAAWVNLLSHGSTITNIGDFTGQINESTVTGLGFSGGHISNSIINNSSGLQGQINLADIDNVNNLYGAFGGYCQSTNPIGPYFCGSGYNITFDIHDSDSLVGTSRWTNIYNSVGNILNVDSSDPLLFSSNLNNVNRSFIQGRDVSFNNVATSIFMGNGTNIQNSSGSIGVGANLSLDGLVGSIIMGNNVAIVDTGDNDYSYLGSNSGGTINTRINSNGFDSWLNLSGGNVGIGTNIPAAKLDVQNANGVSGTGIAQFTNTNNTNTSDGIIVTAGSNAGSGAQIMQFKRPDGTVVGSITQATATTVAFNTTSDERLKENIVDTSFNLDTVLAIKVHDYDYKADPDQTKITGFIAQELYKLFPQAVSVGNDTVDAKGNLINPWQVDYSKLTPILTKGIQDLNAKLEESAKMQNGKIEDINTELDSQGIQVVSLGDELSKLSKRVDKAEEEIRTLKLKVEELEKQKNNSANSPSTTQ